MMEEGGGGTLQLHVDGDLGLGHLQKSTHDSFFLQFGPATF